MKHGIGAAAGLVALQLLASPVAAQDGERRPEVVAAANELMDRFEILLAGLGMDGATLPREQMVQAVDAALPLGTDALGSWASGINFDFINDASPNELEPDPDGRTVLTDARACLAADEAGEVVHFERIVREDFRGHRCVLLYRGVPDRIWVLQSRTFGEGPGRRFSAHYGLAVAVEGDDATARRMIEERLEANIRLSGAMAYNALDLALAKPRDGGPPMSPEEATARVERLAEQLAAVSDSAPQD